MNKKCKQCTMWGTTYGESGICGDKESDNYRKGTIDVQECDLDIELYELVELCILPPEYQIIHGEVLHGQDDVVGIIYDQDMAEDIAEFLNLKYNAWKTKKGELNES